jgi:Flp pilus assembly protein CpaB
LKRSNRLVLLVGVFLAVVAFVGILLLVRSPQGQVAEAPPTTGPVVVAAADIPLSSRIREDQVTTTTVPLDAISAGSFKDPSQVIGQIVRQPVAKGAQITSAILGTNTTGTVTNITTPAGLRSIAVQVDQITGVGTAIKTGDFVDMIVGMTGAEFPIVGTTPGTPGVAVVPGLAGTNSTKVLLQGLQVVGTLLPPVAAAEAAPAPSASGGTTTGGTQIPLNGQQEIVILAGTAQQVEAIKFAQMGVNTATAITLVLRSPDDFIDPTTGAALAPADVKTTGIILKTLVDTYGVLPPDFIVSKGVVPGGPAPSAAP